VKSIKQKAERKIKTVANYVPWRGVHIFKVLGLWGLAAAAGMIGCSPSQYHKKMDKVADKIIADKQQEGLGRTEEFTIERPSDIFRRRLLVGQDLERSGPASLGTDQLPRIPHWPEPNSVTGISGDDRPAVKKGQTIRLSLTDSLMIGARNSFDYQSRKERVFEAALALELERNDFRNIFSGQVSHLISSDTTGDRAVSGMVNSGELGVDRKLTNGTQIRSALAVDLANLFTLGGASSLGLAADATAAVPLMRGSGEYIVTEPLIQAERDTIYAIWGFERYKSEFAVDVADRFFSVLGLLDVLKNSEEDYRSRIASSRRSRRLADAGTLREIEVDQAVQNELSARSRWISARQRYEQQLDSFKGFLGLPPDAAIDLDPNDMAKLTKESKGMIDLLARRDESKPSVAIPHADAPIELAEPSRADAGPLELEYGKAIDLALKNRLDLRVDQGLVYDAQRKVVVAADALGAELTFFGSGNLGSRRSTVSSADLQNAQLRTDKGVFSGLVSLNLPFERTAEAVTYRNSFILLERSVRNVQSLEDQIKLDIRNELRDLVEARENLYIQSNAVGLAQKRVKSVTMFLEAGRTGIQIRDLLDAQDSLVSAQNQLTTAAVAYRLSELRIQRDMEVLMMDAKGLWREYTPEMKDHEEK
jgi:outer membrane protein TolC